MTRTVDVVIVGGNAAAIGATIDAVRRGLRVLVVIRRRRSSLRRHLRQVIGTAEGMSPHQLTVLTGAEVACVDGVKSIEAVVVRHVRTRRLVGFNASALLAFGTRRKPRSAITQEPQKMSPDGQTLPQIASNLIGCRRASTPALTAGK